MGEIKINSLFYADDGMILSETMEDVGNTLEIVKNIAGKYGLKINKKKSKIINFNMRTEVTEIGGIEIFGTDDWKW